MRRLTEIFDYAGRETLNEISMRCDVQDLLEFHMPG